MKAFIISYCVRFVYCHDQIQKNVLENVLDGVIRR